MGQKVFLIGLLTFIERGSILQALLGLVFSAMLLFMYLNSQPYEETRTNTLAVLGQAIIVFAYLSAVVLRVDLQGEVFNSDQVGYVMIASNIASGRRRLPVCRTYGSRLVPSVTITRLLAV